MTDFTPPSDASDPNHPEHDPSTPGWAPEPSTWGDSPPTDPSQQGYPNQPDQQGHPPDQRGYPNQPGYPPAQQGYPGYQYPSYDYSAGPNYPRQSQAVAALVLSILGFFCCGVPSVIGMVLGRQDVKAIDEGLTDPSNRGTAQAAFVVGMVASVIVGGIFLLYLLLIVASAAGSLG